MQDKFVLYVNNQGFSPIFKCHFFSFVIMSLVRSYLRKKLWFPFFLNRPRNSKIIFRAFNSQKKNKSNIVFIHKLRGKKKHCFCKLPLLV